MTCAENIRREMANGAINTSGGTVSITVRIGVSEESGHANAITVDSLLMMASAKLYASKVNPHLCHPAARQCPR
jgi:PleD family two-component response regulator